MMSALPLALVRLSKLRIPFLNHLLGGDICKNFFDFHIFFVSGYEILPVSQLQTQQLPNGIMALYKFRIIIIIMTS